MTYFPCVCNRGTGLLPRCVHDLPLNFLCLFCFRVTSRLINLDYALKMITRARTHLPKKHGLANISWTIIRGEFYRFLFCFCVIVMAFLSFGQTLYKLLT